MRILVVEDETRVAADLAAALSNSGHIVERAGDGETAWSLGESRDFDLVVLDLGLPGIDGVEILKRWRANDRLMPVLVLTARDSWSDKVETIDCGADDYLTKPFRMEELLARVRALLRRHTPHASASLSIGEITLDTRSCKLMKAGVPFDVTPLEYRLLHFLMHNAGRPVPQQELIAHVYDGSQMPDSNAVEVLVTRLRRKLGGDVIGTRRGHGYYMGELAETRS